MPWPTVPVVTTGMDADTDTLPRSDILDLTQKFNQLIAMRAVASGVCDLDAFGLVPNARLSGRLPTVAAWTATQADNLLKIEPYAGTLLSAGIAAPPLTHTGGRHSFSARYGDATANSIYNAIFPGVAHFDALHGVVQIAAGSTIEHAAGIAGYAINDDVSPANAVGVFGCGLVTVNNSAIWGLNTLLQDSAARVAGTGTGRVLVNELDFNVMNPGTQVIGLSVGGNSLAQSTNAVGFIANSLGTGIKWNTGFWAMDNTCQTAMYIGLAGPAAANVNSQPVKFKSHNAANVAVEHTLYGGADFFYIGSSSTTFGVKINAGDLLLDPGKGIVINGMGVLGARKTGYAPMTGIADRGTILDPATATLELAVRRLNALQQDFTAHGSIGA